MEAGRGGTDKVFGKTETEVFSTTVYGGWEWIGNIKSWQSEERRKEMWKTFVSLIGPPSSNWALY